MMTIILLRFVTLRLMMLMTIKKPSFFLRPALTPPPPKKKNKNHSYRRLALIQTETEIALTTL